MLEKAVVLLTSSILALASSSCVAGVEKKEAVRHRDTYVYCNVYLGGACFGIAAGDEMKMSIPADYVLYEVKSADNRIAVVYYGYNQSIRDPALRNKFESCAETEEECKFAIESEAGIEAVYSGSRQEKTVHLLLRDIDKANKKRAREFVDNFRPCKRIDHDLMCRDDAIFALP